MKEIAKHKLIAQVRVWDPETGEIRVKDEFIDELTNIADLFGEGMGRLIGLGLYDYDSRLANAEGYIAFGKRMMTYKRPDYSHALEEASVEIGDIPDDRPVQTSDGRVVTFSRYYNAYCLACQRYIDAAVKELHVKYFAITDGEKTWYTFSEE